MFKIRAAAVNSDITYCMYLFSDTSWAKDCNRAGSQEGGL